MINDVLRKLLYNKKIAIKMFRLNFLFAINKKIEMIDCNLKIFFDKNQGSNLSCIIKIDDTKNWQMII